MPKKLAMFLTLLVGVTLGAVGVKASEVAFVVTDGDSLISSVSLEIVNASGEVVTTLTSGDDGTVDVALSDGSYTYRVVGEYTGYSYTSNESKFALNQQELRKTILLSKKNYSLSVDTDLRIPCNLTAEDYETMLEGTELSGIGAAIEEAEDVFGVNGLYLMGLACEESGYGSSNYARNRNNVVGWAAYDSNPDNASYFDSKSECILYVAEKLKNNYLTEGGSWFEGYSARAVDVHYCTDPLHADKIISIVEREVSKLQ